MEQKSDHDLLRDIHTMMLGSNGQGGCFRSHTQLKNDFYRFRLRVIIGAVVLLGSGGYGIWEIFNLLIRMGK